MSQLEGYSISAAAWEEDILPSRISMYSPDMLENLCMSGRMSWLRLHLPRSSKDEKQQRKAAPVRITPISFVARQYLHHWRKLEQDSVAENVKLSSSAQKVVETLQKMGASFFIDLVQQTGLLRTQVEEALGELVAWGWGWRTHLPLGRCLFGVWLFR